MDIITDSLILKHTHSSTMPVTFEETVEDALRRQDEVNQAKHKAGLKAQLVAERIRFKDNQKLAQMFLGWFSLCVLAWFAADRNGAGILFGVGQTLSSGPEGRMTFNTLGLDQVYTFPINPDNNTTESIELSLVAAGAKREYVFMPVYAIGLYLRADKVHDLVMAKSLSTLAIPPTTKTSEDNPFLALKMTFTRNVDFDNTITPIYKALAGARNKEYTLAVELFKKRINAQVDDRKDFKPGDEIEFLYFGSLKLGISVRGMPVTFVNNADLRRRLLNIFAGEKGWCSELPSTLRKAYL